MAQGWPVAQGAKPRGPNETLAAVAATCSLSALNARAPRIIQRVARMAPSQFPCCLGPPGPKGLKPKQTVRGPRSIPTCVLATTTTMNPFSARPRATSLAVSGSLLTPTVLLRIYLRRGVPGSPRQTHKQESSSFRLSQRTTLEGGATAPRCTIPDQPNHLPIGGGAEWDKGQRDRFPVLCLLLSLHLST